jgi:hypothetical protein
MRRVRLLALAEGAAWGIAAGSVSRIGGAILAVAVMAWRWRASKRSAVIRALEHADPDARNIFVTADELAGGRLIAKPAVTKRVFAHAAASASRLDLRAVFPATRVVQVAVLAGTAWVAVQAVDRWRAPLSRAGSGLPSRSQTPDGAAPQAGLSVTVVIQPPAYTGLEAATLIDPRELQAVEDSAVRISIASPADGIILDHDGAARSLERGADGRFSGSMVVTRTGYVLVTAGDGATPGGGARRMMPVVVSPDALPAVRVTAPGRDLVYAGGNPRIAFDARASDDFGLRSLALRYTKVTGSGEQFEFKEGEIPLAVTTASPREWQGTATRSLADLDLKDGDMLVYRAVAADARPGDGSASSDSFFIEISKLGVAAGDAFTLPQEETRYALSQQMLIIKTERLHRRRASIPQSETTEAALNLAVEQRMIRAEFVFMLGGEVENEEAEAEQSTELQEGRLQNRGQRDLRTATIAMSQAEKLLTGANTSEALVAEHAAVAALQRAFSRDRYILRALATRSQLDPSRRLIGNLSEAVGWRRNPPDVPANRHAAVLQDLLRGIGDLVELARDRNSLAPVFRQRALVLAEEAIRIDPASAPLRETAVQLQRAADAAGDPAARSRALSASAEAASSEARRAHADPPPAAPGVAPALAGAFADALRSGGERR